MLIYLLAYNQYILAYLRYINQVFVPLRIHPYLNENYYIPYDLFLIIFASVHCM